MYQCIMDPGFRRYIPNVTKLFKHVAQECLAFRNRMGNVKIGVKSLVPEFADDQIIGKSPELRNEAIMEGETTTSISSSE